MSQPPLDEIDFIEDEINKERKAHNRKLETKVAKVRSTREVAKDDFKKAKALHKLQIQKAKRHIKTHKLMIKQARNTYKLVKLTTKK